MAFRTTGARRQSEVLTPQRSYCFTLDPAIEQVHQSLAPFGPAVQIGFDGCDLAKAALNHVFFGTKHRGTRYWTVLANLETLGIPTDIAHGIYDYMHSWIKQQLQSCMGGPVNYTEHSYEFLNDRDILVYPIPLHELARYPVYD